MRRQIRVTVNMPTTEEGKAMLHTAMMTFNATVLGAEIRKWDAPADDKRKYTEGLNGRVPWAEGR